MSVNKHNRTTGTEKYYFRKRPNTYIHIRISRSFVNVDSANHLTSSSECGGLL